jgi:hypothetical protein
MPALMQAVLSALFVALFDHASNASLGVTCGRVFMSRASFGVFEKF